MDRKIGSVASTGAHTAAMLSMDTVPACGHTDEVEEFDGHEVEDWTLYVVRLDAGGAPDVFSQRGCNPDFWRELQAVPAARPPALLTASN